MSRRAMNLVPRLGSLAAAALVLSGIVGCAGPGASSPPASTPDAPREPDDIVLQVEQTGGFLPVGAAFGRLPDLTVYADGRAITHGPQIAIYPPPALPNLQITSLPDDAVDALLQRAEDAGLLEDPPEYGRPPVADATTTVLTLNTGSTTVVHEAYALGIGNALPGMTEPDPGLSEAQVQARADLSRFLAAAMDAVATAETHSYEPEAFGVRAAPAGDPAPEDEALITVEPWPLTDVRPADANACVVVDGEAAVAFRSTLSSGNSATRFEQDGVVYELWTRPALPGQAPCPE